MGYEIDMEREDVCEQGTDDQELQAAQQSNFERIGGELAGALDGFL